MKASGRITEAHLDALGELIAYFSFDAMRMEMYRGDYERVRELHRILRGREHDDTEQRRPAA